MGKTQETKVFMSGPSQAVRIPKELRFHCKEVLIKRVGEALVIVPKKDRFKVLRAALDMFSDDFMPTRDQGTQRERDPIL